MNFSYNWLQSFFKRRLPSSEKLAELLTMHAFEVGEVKKVGKDFVLDIDVLPNRGSDCFSHWGIAREIAALTNWEMKIENLRPKEDKVLKTKDFISVDVRDRESCLRYTARVITDVKVEPSPRWIRERLEACGLRPINNVVDITNYVMLETGQPLHAFDGEKIKGKKIVVRFAKKGEKIITFDDQKYDLDEKILVIADTQKPIAIAGVKGGKEAGIDSKTKIVILESANFDSQVIRQGSKLIDLKSDASWRFEHGIDPNLTRLAIERAAYLFEKIADGRVVGKIIDFYPKKVFPKKIKLNLEYVEKLLGTRINKKEITDILKRLDFKVKNENSRILDIEVPTFRRDISLQENLIEEISRIQGYEKIPLVFPISSLVPPKKNLDIFWEGVIKDILKETGFSEVYNYSFVNQEDIEIFQYKQKDLLEIENPTSLEFQYLRPSLIPNLFKNVDKNLRYFNEIKIFELGKIFKKNITEKKALTGLIVNRTSSKAKNPREEVFFEMKGVVDLLLNKLGISSFYYDDYQATPVDSEISIWHPQRTAEIKIDNEKIGFLGEISPKILTDLKIEGRVAIFDIDFEKFLRFASEETIYRPISPYPAAMRDIAVLVPRETRVEEILNKIEIAGGNLIRDVDLFDIYEGEEIPQGKKNLAFRIIYQAEDRTLTSNEIDGIQQKIIEILEKEPEWQVRK